MIDEVACLFHSFNKSLFFPLSVSFVSDSLGLIDDSVYIRHYNIFQFQSMEPSKPHRIKCCGGGWGSSEKQEERVGIGIRSGIGVRIEIEIGFELGIERESCQKAQQQQTIPTTNKQQQQTNNNNNEWHKFQFGGHPQ